MAISAVPAHAGWQMAFSDDFNGTELDLNKWKHGDYFGLQSAPQHGDQQCYNQGNVSVSGGSLVLEARAEYPIGCNPDPGYLTFTSGQISTGFSFQQQYGYYEMRAKLPKTKGVEPLFRLSRPAEFQSPPPDIIVGATSGTSPQALVRYDYINEASTLDSFSAALTADYSTDFHRFGVDWQPGLLVWYVDGVEKARYADSSVTQDQLYMVLQMAVGNNKTGLPDNSTILPQQMMVDYVKVYSRVQDGQPDTLPPGAVNPDSKAPTVAITAPLLLARIQGDGKKFTAKAAASDDTGVAKVEFLLEGQLICTDTTAPYECQITTPVLPKHVLLKTMTLTMRASDAAGNKVSKSREILIVNVK
ncbi:MAG: family 16 glycosylhydrolase [Bdellovibrionales bacterium]|nr:family 16 glycosylhydrolase [Bdellovibrionales bacterium]